MAQYTFDTLLDFDIAKIVLPSGYTKLNYIENQGNASTYIDTGYVPNQNTKFRCEFSTNTNTYSAMGYLGTYRYGFAVERTRIAGIFNTTYYNFYTTIPLGTPQLLEINNPTREVFLNGSLLGAVPQMNFPIGGTFWIGRWNGYNSEYFNGKIYYNEFLENGVSVQKLIPCEDGNGNIGMYDVVTETFFANQGTNPFISGGTAPTITPIAGDTATITSTGDVYKYEGDAWQLWYTIIPPLVFKGITFEQTDYWQKPEMVFRGFSFEITDKKQLDPLFFAQH